MAQAASSLTLTREQAKDQFRVELPFDVELSGVKQISNANTSTIIRLLKAVVKLDRQSTQLKELQAQKKAIHSDYILSAGAVVEAKDRKIGASAGKERDKASLVFQQLTALLDKKKRAADLSRQLITRIQNANGIAIVSPKI